MRPERVPEHLLDPENPWYPVNRISDRLWQIFKAKLTGRTTSDGTSYSSTLNLPEKTADELIQNMKDMGEYPVFNQSLSGMDWYEGYQAFQTWLLEEYLQKPFERKLEEKLLEVEVKHIRKRKKDKPPEKELEEVVEALVNEQPIKEDISPEVTQVLPYIEPAAQEISVPDKTYDEDTPKDEGEETPQEQKQELQQIKIGVDLQPLIDRYSDSLEQIAFQFSNQTSLVRKLSTSTRHLEFNFGIVEFLLVLLIVNCSEVFFNQNLVKN